MEKVIIFGNTGFVGSWVTEYFLISNTKYKIFGYSLKPNTDPSIFKILKHSKRIESQIYANILNQKKLKEFILKTKPDKIIYLVSQPLVKDSLIKPEQTFLTNNFGLINLLEILRTNRLKNLSKLIIFTSDKVYKNVNLTKSLSENDALGGEDPYSASKACQEIIAYSYFNSYFKKKISFVTLRAGNIIGGGDWSKYRIVPDIIKAKFNNKKLIIRNPLNVRPWQHVVDVCRAINLISKKKLSNKIIHNYNIGIFNNKNYPVKDILIFFENYFGKIEKNYIKNSFQEKKYLSITSKKIYHNLNFKNLVNFKNANKLTCEWYDSFYKKLDMIKITINQINKYK